MKQYTFLTEMTTIGHVTGKEITVTPEQYDKLASQHPDKYFSRKQQDEGFKSIKQWYLNKDPKWFKYLKFMKSKGMSEQQVLKMIGL